MQANSEFFLAHLLPATIGYTPDAAALRAAGPRIVVGGRLRGSDAPPGCTGAGRAAWHHPSPLPRGITGLHNPPRAIRRNHPLLAG